MLAIVPDRVSVIIPAYKAGSLIIQSIESALSQTHSDVEVIVVDDCSPEDLEGILRPYDGRIIYHRHSENRGISEARNTGIRLSSGAKMAFLDQDDWWPKDLLTAIVPQVSPGKAVCYDNYIVSDAEGSYTSTTVFSRTPDWKYDSIGHRTMHHMFDNAPMFKIVVHRQDAEKVGGFDKRFFAVEDFNFFVKLLAAGIELKIVSEPKGYYRVHNQSTSVLIADRRARDLARQLRAHRGWLEMARTMPQELVLNPESIAICKQSERYWCARYAETLLRHYIYTSQYSNIAGGAFLKTFLSALPEIASIKIKKVIGRVNNQFRRQGI